MTLITLAYIVIYLIGCVFSFMLINKFNQDINDESEKTQIGEAFLWSLLSWIFLLMVVVVLAFIQMIESRTFKEIKAYFEGKLR